MPVRHAELKVTYDTKDVTGEVTPYLISLKYEEYSESKYTDNLNIVFQDKDGLWISRWFPSRGSELQATITTKEWFGPGDSRTLDCGRHEIDEVAFKGPGNTCELGAVAIGAMNPIRREKVSRGWEGITPRKIAGDLAEENGFELDWRVPGDGLQMERYDQSDQSDIECLEDLCEKFGYMFKVRDGKIVVWQQNQTIDGKEVVIERNRGGYAGHSLRMSSAEQYSKCKVSYQHARQRFLIECEYDGGREFQKDSEERTLKINANCDCIAEAEEMARAALYENNKREITGSLTLLGNPEMLAGRGLILKGFGKFDDALFIIDTARHEWSKSGGYKTRIEVRGLLEW